MNKIGPFYSRAERASERTVPGTGTHTICFFANRGQVDMVKILCEHTLNQEMSMPHALRADLVIEHVDNDVLVLDGQSSTVHRFTGSHAEAIKHLDAGENIEAFLTELADLDAAGLLETESEGSAVSRRGVLLGGSALAGSAALAMSMPGVASAQSAEPGLGVFDDLDLSVSVNDPGGSSDDPFYPVRFRVFSDDSRFVVGETWTLVVLAAEADDSSADFVPLTNVQATSPVVGDQSWVLEFADVQIPSDGVKFAEPSFIVRLEFGGFTTEEIQVDY